MKLKTFSDIFRETKYFTLWFIVSTIIFAVAVWWQNLSLIFDIITSSNIPFISKIFIPLSLLGSITTNFTPWSEIYVITISVLFGANIAIVTYYLRRRIKEIKNSGITLGFLGIITSLFSLGCAACGPLLITTILSMFGASGILVMLPMKGGEFGIIGVALIVVSIYLTINQIENPIICRLKKH